MRAPSYGGDVVAQQQRYRIYTGGDPNAKATDPSTVAAATKTARMQAHAGPGGTVDRLTASGALPKRKKAKRRSPPLP